MLEDIVSHTLSVDTEQQQAYKITFHLADVSVT